MRNLYKYCKFYSGQEPKFIEDDVFKIIVPLDDTFSYDMGSELQKNTGKVPNSAGIVRPKCAQSAPNADLSAQKKLIIRYIDENNSITSTQLMQLLDIKKRRAQIILSKLSDAGIIRKEGASKNTRYMLNNINPDI